MPIYYQRPPRYVAMQYDPSREDAGLVALAAWMGARQVNARHRSTPSYAGPEGRDVHIQVSDVGVGDLTVTVRPGDWVLLSTDPSFGVDGAQVVEGAFFHMNYAVES